MLTTALAPLLPAALARLAAAAQPWRAFYADSPPAQVGLVFAHLAAMLAGGGLALGADRRTWRVWHGPEAARAAQLDELALLHRAVVAALAVAFVTGALLFLSDVAAFAAAPALYVKLALVALLLGNGALMTRVEGALRAQQRPLSPAPDEARWRRLRAHAVASATLWFAVVLAGTALANA